MDIKDLVKNWYYLTKYKQSSHNMYMMGQMNIKDYGKIIEEARVAEDELFKILTDEYNIKNPYTTIPIDLDYVLKIVS